jgi:hypothetical protein
MNIFYYELFCIYDKSDRMICVAKKIDFFAQLLHVILLCLNAPLVN